jgi:hypothetical protein
MHVVRDTVEFMATPTRAEDPDDLTEYPSETFPEDQMSEHTRHLRIREVLRPLLERWLAERAIRAYAGSDQYIYYKKGDVRYRVSPDLYVLPGIDQSEDVGSWKTWRDGIPSFALEAVSRAWKKDYIRGPQRYAELGVGELVVFDFEYDRKPMTRFRFQVYRRVDGQLVRVEATDVDRVYSETLGCHVVAVGTGHDLRLRLGTGPSGDVLFPTEAEFERAEKERERAEKERERAEKLALQRQIEALQTKLEP